MNMIVGQALRAPISELQIDQLGPFFRTLGQQSVLRSFLLFVSSFIVNGKLTKISDFEETVLNRKEQDYV